ncbi:hypothetical protein GS4_01_00480 [Gordonia soli NBRC 108243]|uniref:Uncharacterized protein n=1 Tax=Gordonia soli NBRC 108243 TaxID=1223545 RepID=M0QFR2_9ACTN|nr:hypothetical protein GS4_01_00480 [Gordonia soli NBRC 108243]
MFSDPDRGAGAATVLDADDLCLDSALGGDADTDLGDAGREAQRLERRAGARKVMLAYRIGLAVFDRMLTPTRIGRCTPGSATSPTKQPSGRCPCN